MKKLFTTAFALALCASAAYAQRTVDILVEAVSPAAGSTITDDVPFDVQVKVTNTGPDDMKVGDSLLFVLFLGNSQITNVSVLTANAPLANGGSQIFTVEDITVSLSQGGNGQLCSVVALINGSLPDTVFDNRLAGNNVSCVNYFFANPKGLNDMDEFQSTLYPNPVVGESATISFVSPEAGQANVRVYDLAGRMVAQETVTSLGGNQEVEISAADLKNGIYVYEIQIGETVTRNKFSVNR